MGFCHYHQKVEILCKSHILPKGFYRTILDLENTDVLELHAVGEKHSKRRPVGDYDSNLICSEADRIFGVYDKHAIDFFKTESPQSIINYRGREFIRNENFDFQKTTLFLLSFLWRAHHSTLAPYKNFSLGPKFELKIRTALLEEDGSEQSWFSYIIFWQYGPHDDLLLPFKYPFQQKVNGLNFVFSYFLNFKVAAKLDSRPLPRDLKVFAASEIRSIVMPAEKYSKSPEYRNDRSEILRMMRLSGS
jgi:hypothetical protein